MVDEIQEEDTDMVKRALSWLACSARPLTITELAEATVVENETPYLDPEGRLDHEDSILEILPAGFVRILEADEVNQKKSASTRKITSANHRSSNFQNRRIIQFSHYSVKEYLLSDRIVDQKYELNELSGNNLIAEACMAYLLYLSENPNDDCVLLDYIGKCFHVHAKKVEQDNIACFDRIATDFVRSNDALCLWLAHGCDFEAARDEVLGRTKPVAPWQEVSIEERNVITAPSWIAFHGLQRLMELFLRTKGVDELNRPYPNDKIGSPLHAAALAQQFDMVKFLLESGFDVNTPGGEHLYPLYAACHRNWSTFPRMDIIELLLEWGAEIESRNRSGDTILFRAIVYKYPDLVKLLLRSGSNINAVDSSGATPLSRAIIDDEIFKILIEAGADVNFQCEGLKRTPLISTARDSDLKMLDVILELGADINTVVPGKSGTALIAASTRASEKAFERLLQAGADWTIRGGEYGTNALESARNERDEEATWYKGDGDMLWQNN
jgi:ankyrin repeat protein